MSSSNSRVGKMSPAGVNWRGASFRFFITLFPYILISLRICEVDEFANIIACGTNFSSARRLGSASTFCSWCGKYHILVKWWLLFLVLNGKQKRLSKKLLNCTKMCTQLSMFTRLLVELCRLINVSTFI